MTPTTKTIKTASADEVASAREAAVAAAASADAADEAAVAAAALVVTCVEAVRTGQDQDTTAADLAQLRADAEWAELRAHAARAAAEEAHAAEGRLVHDAAVVAGRKLLADNSPERLARDFAKAVDGLVAFVTAYQAHEAALAEAMSTLSAGNVELELHPSGRRFDGQLLELPQHEFDRSILDVIDAAHVRLGGRAAGASPLEFVVMQHGFGTGSVPPSTVRAIAERKR